MIQELESRGREFADVIKMGRTGIQDAVPITLGQQLNAFAQGMKRSKQRLTQELHNCNHSCLGGTAVGTGMGCLPGFRAKVNKHLSDVLGRKIESYDDLVDGMMAIDDLIACHGVIVALSAQVWKLARDLRLMSSGPESGLCEISFKTDENCRTPLYPQRYASNSLESAIAACNHVAANNSGVLYGLKNGWLDLGACSSIPLRSIIDSSEQLVAAMNILVEKVLPSIVPNKEFCRRMAESSVSNSTMISTIFGYEVGGKVGIFEGSWITGIFFAMATVFYIVGASFSLSLEKPFRTYLKGRIKRVAIPYWKYALVCFPAVVYHYWKSGEIIPLNDFISYVFFTPTVEYRLFDHIWFIPPYLIISLCLPFLCRMIRRCNIPFILFSVVLVLSLPCMEYYESHKSAQIYVQNFLHLLSIPNHCL